MGHLLEWRTVKLTRWTRLEAEFAALYLGRTKIQLERKCLGFAQFVRQAHLITTSVSVGSGGLPESCGICLNIRVEIICRV